MSFIKWIASHFPSREIRRDDGDLYLTRYALFGFMPNKKRYFPIALYLHHFHLADADDAPHNHPWKWALSFILVGGYWEERPTCGGTITRWRGAGTFNFISHATYHRVSELRFKNTWSLFLAGPRISSWGFLDPERGHIDWREYLQERGMKPEY